MTSQIVGLDKLDAKLATLAADVAAQLPAALGRVGSQLAEAVRDEVRSDSGLPPYVRSALADAVGFRVKPGLDPSTATVKVGFSVGRGKARRRRTPPNNSGRTSGVGIGARNSHWFVKGTAERKTRKGRRTGRIAMSTDAVPRAMQQADEVLEAAVNEVLGSVLM